MIAITVPTKVSLFDAAKKAINNANCNNKIITLDYYGKSLVYPNDNLNKLLIHLKTLVLQDKIKQLKSR
jgi:hypothetical protein